MDALVFPRKEVRFAAAMAAGRLKPGAGATVGPLKLTDMGPPDLPSESWERVNTHLAGICGSDLATIDGKSSRYFEPIVSFPFVPGHEVVGATSDGRRVVLEPVLGPEPHGQVPAWPGAAQGDGDDYGHLAVTTNHGTVEPGIQTGFCCSTGGGWAPWFWAHESQLHRIDDAMPDERAVMVEPIAGGIHGALKALPPIADVENPIVAVLGAGTIGLAVIAGLKRYLPNAHVIVGARYPHQQAFAKALGADTVVPGSELSHAVRRAAGCMVVGGQLTSGAHVTIDAVGSNDSVVESLAITRPRGRVVLLGMPADVSLDLTGLWHRETELKGAYTYGTEHLTDGTVTSTFDLAIDTANHFEAERLVSATYRLDDHVVAIAHAATAGRRGAVKIAFDLRSSD
jgi:threonine dehydrogenase-like Zn-dependent dehydrogenase